MLEAVAFIAAVAKMAGYSNIQTTARYHRHPEQAKQKAAGYCMCLSQAELNFAGLRSNSSKLCSDVQDEKSLVGENAQ